MTGLDGMLVQLKKSEKSSRKYWALQDGSVKHELADTFDAFLRTLSGARVREEITPARYLVEEDEDSPYEVVFERSCVYLRRKAILLPGDSGGPDVMNFALFSIVYAHDTHRVHLDVDSTHFELRCSRH
jgi:hypothetical protein